jgi:hypothetical protein
VRQDLNLQVSGIISIQSLCQYFMTLTVAQGLWAPRLRGSGRLWLLESYPFAALCCVFAFHHAL